MNRLIYAIIGLVALGLVGGFLLANSTDDEDANTAVADQASDTDSRSASQTQPEDEVIEVENAGSSGLVNYSGAALAMSETEDNLLFFHASWCTVCNSVERNLEASNIPDNLTIFKIDYDSPEGQELAQQYDIPIQYTMVQVDSEGNEVTQWVNNFGDGLDEITSRLN